MKNIVITISFILAAHFVKGQTLDSIFFNLYTDSLKKGTYNYINVEGRFTDGTFLPLSDKELKLSSSGGKFNGNSLFIDSAFRDEKVTIKAVVIRNPRLAKEIDIYIKKVKDNEKLPTLEEVMKGPSKDTAITSRKKKSKKKG